MLLQGPSLLSSCQQNCSSQTPLWHGYCEGTSQNFSRITVEGDSLQALYFDGKGNVLVIYSGFGEQGYVDAFFPISLLRNLLSDAA